MLGLRVGRQGDSWPQSLRGAPTLSLEAGSLRSVPSQETPGTAGSGAGILRFPPRLGTARGLWMEGWKNLFCHVPTPHLSLPYSLSLFPLLVQGLELSDL